MEETIKIKDLIHIINRCGYLGATSMGNISYISKDKLLEEIHNYQDNIEIKPLEKDSLNRMVREIDLTLKDENLKKNIEMYNKKMLGVWKDGKEEMPKM